MAKVHDARPSQILRWLHSPDPAVREFVLMQVHDRDLALLARACDILTEWHWASITQRRHAIPTGEVDAAERRHRDLIRALDTIPSMRPLAEALQSPSALVREALLLALTEIAR